MTDLSTSLSPWLVGLTVFGGVDPVLKVIMSESSFDVAFSKEQSCEMLKKVGATLLTWACLQNHNQVVMPKMQQTTPYTSSNPQTAFVFKEHSFNNDVLKASIDN